MALKNKGGGKFAAKNSKGFNGNMLVYNTSSYFGDRWGELFHPTQYSYPFFLNVIYVYPCGVGAQDDPYTVTNF
jgi:hypothetical protein